MMFSRNAIHASMRRSKAGKKFIEAGYAKGKTDKFSREVVRTVR